MKVDLRRNVVFAEQKQYDNIIKYQLSHITSESNPFQRALEVETARNLLSHTSSTVRDDLKFGKEQQDASEYITPFLDALYLGKKQPFIQTSEISGISVTGNQCSTIELPVNGNNIQKLLHSYQSPETVQYAGQRKSKHLSVYVNEDCEEITLKMGRFTDYDVTTRAAKKDNRDIACDTITLPIYGDENFPNSGENKTFEPTAFIVHSGSSTHSGHYFTYVKERDNSGHDQWYRYDDSSKQPASDSDAQRHQKQAYIVKYSAQDDRGQVRLPSNQSQVSGSDNLGNTCWANAVSAFLGSYVSFHEYKNIKLTPDEKSLWEASKSRRVKPGRGNTRFTDLSFRDADFDHHITDMEVLSESDASEYGDTDPAIFDSLFRHQLPQHHDISGTSSEATTEADDDYALPDISQPGDIEQYKRDVEQGKIRPSAPFMDELIEHRIDSPDKVKTLSTEAFSDLLIGASRHKTVKEGFDFNPYEDAVLEQLNYGLADHQELEEVKKYKKDIEDNKAEPSGPVADELRKLNVQNRAALKKMDIGAFFDTLIRAGQNSPSIGISSSDEDHYCNKREAAILRGVATNIPNTSALLQKVAHYKQNILDGAEPSGPLADELTVIGVTNRTKMAAMDENVFLQTLIRANQKRPGYVAGDENHYCNEKELAILHDVKTLNLVPSASVRHPSSIALQEMTARSDPSRS